MRHGKIKEKKTVTDMEMKETVKMEWKRSNADARCQGENFIHVAVIN